MKKLLAYLLCFVVFARPFLLILMRRAQVAAGSTVNRVFTFLYKNKVAPFSLFAIIYLVGRQRTTTAGSLPPRSLKTGYILKPIGGKLITL